MISIIGIVVILILVLAIILTLNREKDWAKFLLWFPKEIVAMYSNKDSFFSKKRFESSIGFIAGVGIICCYVWINRHTLSNWDMIIDAGVLLGIAGYTVSKIQEEKQNLPPQ
ncbi:MAG: hypothetical protein WCP52_00155 [Bacteroidota bacterium]